jgi:hypothetical protein
MLLVPFVSALILARRVDWPAVSALMATVAVFALREPIVVLARQRWVWEVEKPDSMLANRYLLRWSLLLILSALHLASSISWPVLVALASGAATFTTFAVYLSVKNRQRSLALQAMSAAGLNCSAFAAWFSVRQDFPPGIVLLWGLLSFHSVTAVLAVRARLDSRIAARSPSPQRNAAALVIQRQALAASWLMLAGSALTLASAVPALSIPLAFSGVVHLADLRRLSRPEALETPLKKVGWRAVGVSVTFTALVLIALLL